MPRSKRQKIVPLTRTESKGREAKDELFKQIRETSDSNAYIFVLSVDNMRNNCLKEVRMDWNDSRFFFGKNKVMGKSLGTTPEEEYKENLSQLIPYLSGNVGLLFTNRTPAQVSSYFSEFTRTDYARAGQRATHAVTIPAGPVMRNEEEKMPHNMEPQLRKLRMPTRLVNGVVTLDSEFTICNEGDVLTPEQAQLLKLFYVTMADFKMTPIAYWWNGAVKEMTAEDEE